MKHTPYALFSCNFLYYIKKKTIFPIIQKNQLIDGYRGKHVVTKLLEQDFKYLGTTKPLISIADYKIPMFEHIIKKYI